MLDFLDIVSSNNGFDEGLSHCSLDDCWSLRSDASFGSASFTSSNVFFNNLNKDFMDLLSFGSMFGDDPLPLAVSKSWFHRTLCSRKAIDVWKSYRKIYYVDSDWYSSLVDGEDDVVIDFLLLRRLPFNSFFIDFSGIPFLHTKHYENVIGALVTVLSVDKIHVVFIDVDNAQYNPVQFFGGKYYSTEFSLSNGSGNDIVFRSMIRDVDLDSMSPYGLSWRDFYTQHGELRAIDVSFPDSCVKYDTGSVRFVDFMLESTSDGNVLSAKTHNAFDCFGWHLQFDSVIEANDLRSPVVGQVMRFILLFLYFLHSKTEDVERSTRYSNYGKSSRCRVDNVDAWLVGSRYGAKVRTLNKKCQLYGNHVVMGERSRPRAYVRRAHWHSYWCGSCDNRHLEVRWLEPTYCNGSISDIISVINVVSDDDLHQSNGEHAVHDYLQRVGVSFDTECVVLIKGHNRRFDFDVLLNGRHYFIEFDGEQHFKPVERFGGIDGFRERRRADFDKNKYAKSQKIPLLRIRYDQMIDIPKLIDSFFDRPRVGQYNPILSNSDYYNRFD